jgi:hypothetical protein
MNLNSIVTKEESEKEFFNVLVKKMKSKTIEDYF